MVTMPDTNADCNSDSCNKEYRGDNAIFLEAEIFITDLCRSVFGLRVLK